MASTLKEWKEKSVNVITCDGRCIHGTLIGYDQLQNLVLKKSHERSYSIDNPVEYIPLGLYVIRGDNVAIISDMKEGDEVNDIENANNNDLRALPIKPLIQMAD